MISSFDSLMHVLFCYFMEGVLNVCKMFLGSMMALCGAPPHFRNTEEVFWGKSHKVGGFWAELRPRRDEHLLSGHRTLSITTDTVLAIAFLIGFKA